MHANVILECICHKLWTSWMPCRLPKAVSQHISILIPHLGGKAHPLRSAIVTVIGVLIQTAYADPPEETADAQGSHRPLYSAVQEANCRPLDASAMSTHSLLLSDCKKFATILLCHYTRELPTTSVPYT